MKKLIFLDFDGVLHPNFSLGREYFSQMGYLLGALDGFAGDVEIIISSSWRFQWPEDVLLQKLPKPLAVLVTGVTPMVGPGRYQRYREINAYLESRPCQHDWRALDDAINEFPGDCTELIACDGRVGLNGLNTSRLLAWLNVRCSR
jgi:hypothetical protein